MTNKHQELLNGLHKKRKIRVIYLVIHTSVWKVDSVFQRMLKDPYFEPEIFICPYIQYGEERMLQDMEHAYRHFKNKGYPVTKSRRDDGSWVKLEEVMPDVVFFTNPYKLTRNDYYITAYSNYLSCYIPYYFMATKHAGDELVQYNNIVFLEAWKVYWPHEYCNKMHKQLSANKGVNGLTVGYPAVESLYSESTKAVLSQIWKSHERKLKKIIYAPHHTIENSTNSLSSFLMFGEFMKALAIVYQDKVQWSFKPHPILKTKLYLHPLWGKEKTDQYYNFWENQTYTQLDEGEYEELFLNSDAIIHDCSSFIVEYAITRKPCLFLLNENNLEGLLNEFGAGVINVYDQAKNVQEIESFVCHVVANKISKKNRDYTYLESYLLRYYKDQLPSARIINDIKQSLGAWNGE